MNHYQFNFIQNVSSILQEHFRLKEEVADFIGCQFALESSYGESSLVKTHSNYCGMKTPLVRVSVALNYRDLFDKWARYSSLLNCIYDFMFCLAYHKPLTSTFETIKHYSDFIRNWYCPENSYIPKINQIYQSFLQSKLN